MRYKKNPAAKFRRGWLRIWKSGNRILILRAQSCRPAAVAVAMMMPRVMEQNHEG
jgi:hypothetical protein